MGFEIDFYPPVQNDIESWGLPRQISREFYMRLDDDAKSSKFLSSLYCIETGLYEHTIAVEESVGRRYIFMLRLRLWSDTLLRVEQCSAFGAEGGRIFWSSR